MFFIRLLGRRARHSRGAKGKVKLKVVNVIANEDMGRFSIRGKEGKSARFVKQIEQNI